MRSSTPDQRGLTAYQLLVRAYPRAFRARFGPGLADAFVRDHADAGARGAGATALFWARTVGETCWFGVVARAAALARALGRIQESFMRSLLFDVRDAFRALQAAPAVALMAVLSVALGIGANTALFSIMNGLVLKSLPVRNPAALVLLDHGSWTNPIWEAIRAREDQVFDGAFAWSNDRFDLAASGPSDLVDGAYASGQMFDVLGVVPVRGRLFTEADDAHGGGPDGPVAVVSYAFWQRRYGGSEAIIGQQLNLSRVPFTIVGVAPPDFLGPEVGRASEVFIPIGTEKLIRGAESMLDERSAWWLEVIGRMKPGQTIAGATTALQSIQPELRAATIPPNYPVKQLAQYLTAPFTLSPAASGRSDVRRRLAEPLTIILVVVGLVLLIACANIANLLLARATARRHELSVRLALGSSRARLVRQLLVESLMLAIAGGVLGLMIARLGSGLLVRQLATSTTTVVLDLGIDWRVFAFTAAVTLVTAVFFGLGPALATTGVDPVEAIKEQGRGVTGDRRLGVRNVLVVAQVGLSLVLVVAAGLFIRTFSALVNAPLGIRPDPIVMVHAGAATLPVDARMAAFDRLEQDAAHMPGVLSAATSFIAPLSGQGWNTELEVPGPDGPVVSSKPNVPWVNAVTPGWFATYGMHLVSGRDFAPADRVGNAPVIIINETFSRTFFKSRNPLGQQILGNLDGGGPNARDPYEVVGIVSDAAYRSVRAGAPPTVYIPLAQLARPVPSVTIAVRVATASPSAVLVHALSSALANADPRIGFTIAPMTDQLHGTLAQERLVAVLSGLFGGLALLLAAVGLYGVTAYAVNRRRSEIGVRIALGANARDVVRLMLARVGWLTLAGIALGAVLALWAARFISATLLFGLGARDPLTFVGATLVLAVVGLIAGWLPARQAARIDPVNTLRES